MRLSEWIFERCLWLHDRLLVADLWRLDNDMFVGHTNNLRTMNQQFSIAKTLEQRSPHPELLNDKITGLQRIADDLTDLMLFFINDLLTN